MMHKIKIQKSFADAIMDGRKTFEIRFNDRGYQSGDQISFEVVDSSMFVSFHKIKERIFEITYVLSGYGLKDNYVVFGIKPYKEVECE